MTAQSLRSRTHLIPRRHITILLGLSFAARTPVRAQASSPASAAAQTSADPVPRWATREFYSACLDQEDHIERTRRALSRTDADLQQLAAKFKIADDQLNEQVRQHAPRTRSEVESYNRAVDHRNQNVKAFNARSRALQLEQSRFNAMVRQHQESCGTLTVSTEVKNLVDRERGARRSQP